MRCRLLLITAALSLAFAPAPFQRRDPVEEEQRRLRGGWVLVSESHAGKPRPVPHLRYGFSGRWLFRTDPLGTSRWEVKLDPRASPRALDYWESAEDDPVGLLVVDGESILVKAAYAVRGDTLTICHDLSDPWARPGDVSGEGTSRCLQVLRREKR